MCDEAVDDYLAESNLFLIDFFNVKCLKKLVNALHTNDVILFYNEDFNKTLLFLVKDIFLLGILIELNLKMIMSFIKMILILQFMSDFWFGVLNLKSTEHFKKR